MPVRRPWLLTLLAAMLCALFLFPVYWMIVTAILPTSQVLARSPSLLPSLSDVEFRAFLLVFERKPLATWLTNSALVMVGSTAISLVISALAGYSLSRFRTRAQELTGLTLLLTKMLPSSLIVIPFFIMATTFHLIDSLFALMLANAGGRRAVRDVDAEGLLRRHPARARAGGDDRRLRPPDAFCT
jgi:multiple sugar transport system permease protein